MTFEHWPEEAFREIRALKAEIKHYKGALERIRDETTLVNSADGVWHEHVFDFRARGLAIETLKALNASAPHPKARR